MCVYTHLSNTYETQKKGLENSKQKKAPQQEIQLCENDTKKDPEKFSLAVKAD